jgi:hypothetical protein
MTRRGGYDPPPNSSQFRSGTCHRQTLAVSNLGMILHALRQTGMVILLCLIAIRVTNATAIRRTLFVTNNDGLLPLAQETRWSTLTQVLKGGFFDVRCPFSVSCFVQGRVSVAAHPPSLEMRDASLASFYLAYNYLMLLR